MSALRIRLSALLIAVTVSTLPAAAVQDSQTSVSDVRAAVIGLSSGSGTVGVSLHDGVGATLTGYPPLPEQSQTGVSKMGCVSFARESGSTRYAGWGCLPIDATIDPALAMATGSGSGTFVVYKLKRTAFGCYGTGWISVSQKKVSFSVTGVQVFGTGVPRPSSSVSLIATHRDGKYLNVTAASDVWLPDPTQVDPDQPQAGIGEGMYGQASESSAGGVRHSVTLSSGISRGGTISAGRVSIAGHGSFTKFVGAYMASGVAAQVSYSDT